MDGRRGRQTDRQTVTSKQRNKQSYFLCVSDVYLDKAKTQLDTLSSEKLTDFQRSCVNMLQEICQRLSTAENIDVEKPPQKTAFVQTYD